jgi:hypothetical protein
VITFDEPVTRGYRAALRLVGAFAVAFGLFALHRVLRTLPVLTDPES